MPAPVPVPVRAALFRRWYQGQSVADLAAHFALSPRTVRSLVRRFRSCGDQGIVPSYPHRAPPAAGERQRLRDQARALRQQHPGWGAGLIRVFLLRQHLRSAVPTERTLQRWLRRAGLGPAPKGRRPTGSAARATRPHEVWQMDAKERVTLQSGQQVSWLRLVDECSGAVLDTSVFPPRPLEPRARRRRAGQPAPNLWAVGPARGAARG